MISVGLNGTDSVLHDVCVIGAGPVGIALALELARLDQSVLLLESGDAVLRPEAQCLAEAEIADPKTHVPMNLAVQRRLGGASNLWGGRCVALDELDFEVRDHIPHSGWPIKLADLTPYFAGASAFIGLGEPVFERPLPGSAITDRDFEVGQLERWSQRPRLAGVHARKLREATAIDLRLRSTVVGFSFLENGRVAKVLVRGPGSATVAVEARHVVIATGGIEAARLLLAARAENPCMFGGEDGPLGRYYQGHVYGSVANVVLKPRWLDAGLDYILDHTNTYVRRRFTPGTELQRRMHLTNAALWPDYPPLHNPAHRNGVLSLAYLALSIPPVGRRIVVESIRRNYVGTEHVRHLDHLLNILRDAPRTAAFIPWFLHRHYLARYRMPGFFQRNSGQYYSLRYHSEHLPDATSRVTLTHERDAYGLPRLSVNLRYRPEDVEPLIRTHECFGRWLERNDLGTLSWAVPPDRRVQHVLGQCYDGHHQIGTTRMGTTTRTGVVDADCRVFGSSNLFVAGCSVFPTSGAANPTFTAVTLALRVAALLAKETHHGQHDRDHDARPHQSLRCRTEAGAES